MAYLSRRWTDAALRAGGLVLIGCAVLAAGALSGPQAIAAAGGVRPIDFLLALGAFLCGTTGTALLIVGAHLSDAIALGPRWRRFRR